MGSDTIKLIFTYLIALVVIVVGLGMLFISRNDPAETAQSLQLLLAGFIGSAITFVFSQESAKQATRAAQSSAAPQPDSTTTTTTTRP